MKRAGAVAAGLLLGAASVGAQPLVMVIDSATEMPMARIQGTRVVDGMNHELGALLAQRMGREIRYLAVPRKRVTETLERGQGDLVCTFKPAWLPGPLQWSQAFFRQSEVIATRRAVSRPRRLEDLRGQRIGTVLGFVYVELEQTLGKDFVREDAPNALANLRKLAAGHLSHAVVEGRLLSHTLREGRLTLELHPRLEVGSLLTQCALSSRSSIPLIELDRAIDRILQDGSLQLLYAKYD